MNAAYDCAFLTGYILAIFYKIHNVTWTSQAVERESHHGLQNHIHNVIPHVVIITSTSI